jgi:hypothetical protein
VMKNNVKTVQTRFVAIMGLPSVLTGFQYNSIASHVTPLQNRIIGSVYSNTVPYALRTTSY